MKARRISKMQMPSGKHFLYESIAHRLREEIASGTFQPGERLPSLDTFSETFRVNRLTVRKAIEVLREEGLVYAIPAQGTYVRQVQEGAPASGTARAQGAGSARHPARKSRVVGLLSQVLVPANFGPYHQEIIAGINEALPEYGANLLIYAVGMMRPEELAEIRDSAPTDAMIYMGPFDRVLLARLVRSGPPAVLVDFEARGLPCDSICIDNELGGHAVGQLLIETGCGDGFALITGTADDAVADRVAGIRRAFSEAGSRYAPLAVIDGHYTRKGGCEAVSSLLSRGLPLPKAIFCLNDEMALGALDALAEANIRVPEQVRLIGFDGIPLGAEIRPRLSTVTIDLRQIGRQAVQTLFRRLEDPSGISVRLSVSPQLFRRDTY